MLPTGVTDFKSLQEHIDTPNPAIRYFAFDLLSLDGKDWRKKKLTERRAQLAKLLAAKGVSDFLIYADYVEGSGPEFFAQACAAGLEGIVSKRADRPYISGRGKDWLKIKCLRGEEFVIGGYSRSDVKGKPFSSLLLGTLRGRHACLFRQGRHRLRRGGLRKARAEVPAARARALALRGGAARGAQGRGVARAEARRADRLYRADA